MDLPEPLGSAFPELGAIDLTEPLAPCSRCVMAPGPADAPDRIRFTAPARCCTYHPTLANWMAGAALRAGGTGAEAIRRRLTDLDGLDRLAIRPVSEARRAYAARTPTTFGRDETLTCPYWVDGPLGCSVHPFRNGVCRTWSCRTTHGSRGMVAWVAVRDMLRSLEEEVAEAVAGEPEGDWEAYYVACSVRAEALGAGVLRTERNLALLGRIAERIHRRDQPLPLCPTPALRAWHLHEDRVELESWSPYDRVTVPPWIFQLLGRLDGKTPWPDAVRAAEEAIGAPLPADLVPHLWWRGLLAAPEADEGDTIEVLPA